MSGDDLYTPGELTALLKATPKTKTPKRSLKESVSSDFLATEQKGSRSHDSAKKKKHKRAKKAKSSAESSEVIADASSVTDPKAKSKVSKASQSPATEPLKDTKSELAVFFSGVGGVSADKRPKSKKSKKQKRASAMRQLETRKADVETMARTLFLGNIPSHWRERDVRRKLLSEWKPHIEAVYLSNYCKSHRNKGARMRFERRRHSGKHYLPLEFELTEDSKDNMNAWVVFSAAKHVVSALKLNGKVVTAMIPTHESLLRKGTRDVAMATATRLGTAKKDGSEEKKEETKEEESDSGKKKAKPLDTTQQTGGGAKIQKQFTLRADFADSSKQRVDEHCVFIGGLRMDYTEEEIRRHFAHCGAIANVRILRDARSLVSRGCGFVEFDSLTAVSKALDLHRSRFLGEARGNVLRVLPYINDQSKKSRIARAKQRGFTREIKGVREKEQLKEVLKSEAKQFKNARGKVVLRVESTAEHRHKLKQRRGRDANMKKLRWREHPEMRVRSEAKAEKRELVKTGAKRQSSSRGKRKGAKEQSTVLDQLDLKKAKILKQQTRFKHKMKQRLWHARHQKAQPSAE